MAILLVILGVCSVIYGVSVMLINSGTLFFAVWYVIGALLIAAGWATHAGVWESVPLLAKRVGGVVLALALVAFVGTQALIVSKFNEHGHDNLDYLVVLGAQVLPDGTPSTVLRYRLDAAYDYLTANPDTTCIVSGGQGPNEAMPEAHGMAAYLQSRGIAEERIVIEDRSLDTSQNIAYSMELFNPEVDSVGIVTNDFHVYRATAIARKAGMADVCGIAAYSDGWYQPNNMLRESMGLVKDTLSGNMYPRIRDSSLRSE